MAKIINFPDLLSQRPHDPDAWRTKPRDLWTPKDEVEEARGKIADFSETISLWEHGALVSTEKYIIACVGIPMWEEILAEREAALSPNALMHNGIFYTEMAGQA